MVIIGSGLGGLECAYLLAKNGKKVCVLEKNSVIGGCLQSFKRGKHIFETGFHYIGALGKGEILERLFSYFGLMSLDWVELDKEGFDEIILNDKHYLLASGYERFAARLASYFPSSKEEIKNYTALLKRVAGGIIDPVLAKENTFDNANPLFGINAFDYLTQTLKNEELMRVVSGNSLKMELSRATLPLYTFAQINSSFVESAWRLRGGGSQVADKLKEGIEAMGGEVFAGCAAQEIVEEGGKIQYIATSAGRFFGDHFISNISPALTLELLKESRMIRPIFRKRINNLEQTFGGFTVNIALKQNKLPYLNRNIYYYDPSALSPWDILGKVKQGENKAVLITFRVPNGYTKASKEAYTSNIDIIAPMAFSRVAKWAGTEVGHRGEEYVEFKHKTALECIDMASQALPMLKGAIESFTTSTPLTYMNYTGAVKGTAYGIRKDCNNLLRTLLTPKTPFENLFFTGQNLNLHGVLGVTITALLTCKEIIGEAVRECLKQ